MDILVFYYFIILFVFTSENQSKVLGELIINNAKKIQKVNIGHIDFYNLVFKIFRG